MFPDHNMESCMFRLSVWWQQMNRDTTTQIHRWRAFVKCKSILYKSSVWRWVCNSLDLLSRPLYNVQTQMIRFQLSLCESVHCAGGWEWLAHGGYVMFLLVFLEKTIGLTTDLIIIIQSSKERERARASFYHWLLPSAAYIVNRQTPNHHRKTKKEKNPTFDFLVNNIQGCIIQFFRNKKRENSFQVYMF